MNSLNIVTIVAKNYLAQARILINSFKKYHPDGSAFVLIVDHIEEYFDPEKEKFTVIQIDELRPLFHNMDSFCFQYTILELCTALKPFVLQYLLQKYKLSNLIYFDPDILITATLQPLVQLLDHHNIVLTPHITQPYKDNKKPSETDILQAGAYNLGFIALSHTETTISMLRWWQERLAKKCVVDIANGLFVDQKWIDLVPGLFQKTYILCDPGYNVAYWNLHEHTIAIEEGKFICSGKLLRFFHFSGFNPDHANSISKHQDRHSLASIGQAAKLFFLYAKLLLENGFHECKKWPYSYATFDNQVVIPEISRRIYLNLKQQEKFGNPFKTNIDNSFFKWLTSFDAGHIPPLLSEIYRLRVDLQIAFPDINGIDKVNFLTWCLRMDAVEQYQLDKSLLVGINTYLNNNHSFPTNSYSDHDKKNHLNYSERVPGVNLLGYLNSEKGMGAAARSNILCLEKTKFPFVINNIIDVGSFNQENIKDIKFSLDNPYKVNLIHVNADDLPELAKQKGEAYFKNCYNIGRWEWELSHVPEEWHASFDFLDEIWVASSFIQEALARISPIPVVKIPHAIKIPDMKKSSHDRAYFGIPKSSYVFLFIFDFHSSSSRKNPQGAIQAFKKVFTMQDDAVLIIKSSHSQQYLAEFEQLLELSKNANIRLFDKVMSEEEVMSLMHHADCYVSLHRCEGFGLTIAEAMCLGKPVIATAYSGNVDFMSPDTCYSVNYTLVEIDQDYGPYKKGWLWADPDLEHAASLMRHVYEHRDEAITIGLAAREYMIKHFSPAAVGEIYQKRLDHIFNSIGAFSIIKQFIPSNIELSFLEQKAMTLNINSIPVASRRPIFGFLGTLYKRFIRKSIYWLLEPLMRRLHEIIISLIQVEKKSVNIQRSLLNKINLQNQKISEIYQNNLQAQEMIQKYIRTEEKLKIQQQEFLSKIAEQNQEITKLKGSCSQGTE